MFATSDNVPEKVTTVLDEAHPLFAGSSIQDVLSTISQVVDNALSDRDSPTPEHLEQYGSFSMSDDEAIFDDDDEMDWDGTSDNDILVPLKDEAEARATLRRDLRAAKNAGFKVGYLGALGGSVIVTVSCRIGRLEISEDAMQAWNVNRSEYLVLLIRYPSAYRDLNELLHGTGSIRSSLVQMYVGLCTSYKPSLESAIKVFQGNTADKESEDQSATAPETTEHAMRRLFIDKTLNALLNERLISIVQYRLKFGFSWTGAEMYAQQYQGKPSSSNDALADGYFEPDSWSSSVPTFLATDYIAQAREPSQLSLPLLAMQFTLRHFVKCTEFCLVCHCKTRSSFEALKPYVCSNRLCLYQYMALGMGPSLEYEISLQPYVIDLLVSLTYARAMSGNLEDFPTGLGLMVPEVSEPLNSQGYSRFSVPDSNQVQPTITGIHSALFDPATMTLSTGEALPLKAGDWIVITTLRTGNGAPNDNYWHCRVQSIVTTQQMQISRPANIDEVPSDPEKFDSQLQEVKFAIYDKNFDEMSEGHKRAVLPMLLDTLPNIDAMTSFLGTDWSEKPLSTWKDVVSPAALDILRWIFASNRSYIKLDDASDPEHLVSGMDDYIQFRLVQGAPDKEHHFINAMKTHGFPANPSHPTLFAWHGSPLHNWHSILREGLHFKKIANGRACGNGVYMASQIGTSLGYSGDHWGHYGNSHRSWPRSKLNISMAISLNEVVNAPTQFVCCNTTYVVDKLEWIQPRYLFVKCQGKSEKNGTHGRPSAVYKQDPKRLVYGHALQALEIPASVLGSQRLQALRDARASKSAQTLKRASPSSTPKLKRAKWSKKKKHSKEEEQPVEPEIFEIFEPVAERSVEINFDDACSVATTFEDLQCLLSDDEGGMKADHDESNLANMPDQIDPKTDFVPGTLQEASLPLLNPPAYATTSATKVLQQHLQATLKVQQKEPPHSLGWYVDPNLISTVYQWIVELHSFDPDHPLSKDLKKINMKSVVLEFRFGPQFPMAPPFVRVIRPRFLEFNLGGGGHVTAGGAMCMELLTNSGWLPTASIENVLLQVRMAILNMEPRPARLYTDSKQRDYTNREAMDAYARACRVHGWEVPGDFKKLSLD